MIPNMAPKWKYYYISNFEVFFSDRNNPLASLLFCTYPDKYPDSIHKIFQTAETYISNIKINPKFAPKSKLHVHWLKSELKVTSFYVKNRLHSSMKNKCGQMLSHL